MCNRCRRAFTATSSTCWSIGPARRRPFTQYPVIWAGGDVNLKGAMLPILEDYVKNGGTLVTTITQANDLPAHLTGFKATGKFARADTMVA